MRYFQKSFPYATAPANGAEPSAFHAGMLLSSGDARCNLITFAVPMRTSTPSITLYRDTRTSTAGQWGTNYNGSTSASTSNIDYYSDNGFDVQTTIGGTAGAAILMVGEWTANAEL